MPSYVRAGIRKCARIRALSTCSDVANFSDLVLKMSLAVVVSTVTIRVTSSQILRSRVPEDVETD